MTYAEVIRAAIPGASEALCEHVLWGRTPYPMGIVTAKSLYRAAARLRRAKDHGIALCDMCDRVADPNEWMCSHCRSALIGAAENVPVVLAKD